MASQALLTLPLLDGLAHPGLVLIPRVIYLNHSQSRPQVSKVDVRVTRRSASRTSRGGGLPGSRAGSRGASGQPVGQGAPVARVAVIDNYDSFTYNLCQYLGDLGCQYDVFRNDELTIDELKQMNPRGILISPGPGTPEDSGISLDVVRQLAGQVPIFGVCMGLQCIGQAFGGRIVRAPGGVMHGKTSEVFHNQLQGDGLLGGLPSPFVACRYHSLVIERETFPNDQLEVTAWTANGLVMGVRHRQHRFLEGVQFHPESIITENGQQIVANFVHSLVQHERSPLVPTTVLYS